MKLFTFGCSLTALPGIEGRLSKLLNIKVINNAASAGSNQYQVNCFNQLALENKISKDDIIYWQITHAHRAYQRILPLQETLDELKAIDFKGSSNHYIEKHENIFDGYKRVDILSNSPWIDRHLREWELDSNQFLQNLLTAIVFAKKITKNILIVFGWDEIMSKEALEIFKTYLETYNISYIDTSYLTYVRQNNLEFFDDHHPTTEASEIFAEKLIYPKILEILKSEN